MKQILEQLPSESFVLFNEIDFSQFHITGAKNINGDKYYLVHDFIANCYSLKYFGNILNNHTAYQFKLNYKSYISFLIKNEYKVFIFNDIKELLNWGLN